MGRSHGAWACGALAGLLVWGTPATQAATDERRDELQLKGCSPLRTLRRGTCPSTHSPSCSNCRTSDRTEPHVRYPPAAEFSHALGLPNRAAAGYYRVARPRTLAPGTDLMRLPLAGRKPAPWFYEWMTIGPPIKIPRVEDEGPSLPVNFELA